MTEHEAVVKARAKADVPVGEVGTPRAQAGAPPQDTRANRRNDYYADNGVWLFPYTFYDAGGGCGGKKILLRGKHSIHFKILTRFFPWLQLLASTLVGAEVVSY